MNAFQKNMQMLNDTNSVLNKRLPLLEDMQNNPQAMLNPANWLEVQRMFWEKAMAFSQAYNASAPDFYKLMNGQTSNSGKFLQDSLRVQQKALAPIQKAVGANAKRLGK